MLMLLSGLHECTWEFEFTFPSQVLLTVQSERGKQQSVLVKTKTLKDGSSTHGDSHCLRNHARNVFQPISHALQREYGLNLTYGCQLVSYLFVALCLPGMHKHECNN